MNLILGIVFFAGTLLFLLSIFKGIGLDMLINYNALMIIFGGTIVALFVGFPAGRILDTIRNVIGAFRDKSDRDSVVKEILGIARIYRKAEIRKLENGIKQIDNDFLRLGVGLLIDHTQSEEIQNIMEREMSIRLVNYNLSQNILKTIARLAPSLGLAGTIISLVQMFRNFHSADAMTSLMSVALMSTFYGVIISNLVALPLSAKLREKAIISEMLMNITIEGILAINDGEHPLRIEDRLSGHTGGHEKTPAATQVKPSLAGAAAYRSG